ncbi:hypothetical protein H4J50_14620 [Colwellia sp. 6M3]|jgi:hypothetical protein|uniref:hypothetical protein n=1 Tax=Colwellia sp. 6M3 TaxID=2759849 RepID=UPI0015F4C6A0|nr:hypothetical protein [Colwellia sp. 6M3]MBA6417249.1 hypothetical protein [Colwellia sp. 6M3]
MAHSQQRFFVISLLCMTIVLSSGCQLTSNNVNSRLTYGEYYLALQQLSPQQLLEEVIKQQTQVEQISNESPNYNAQIKLLLLYSSPKSPIYNSFHAKMLLNKLKNEENDAAFASITPSEQALISLLHDQLNQRLLMRNRLIAEQKLQQENFQKTGTMQQQNAIKIQQNLIEQVKLLEQTIKQLKDIEQAIDKRDQ